jgi:simple sugar transport system permease protein
MSAINPRNASMYASRLRRGLGALSSLGFTLQSRGVDLPPEVFAALPYLLTIVVLVLVSSGWARSRLGAPAALGVPYVREER